MPTSRDQRTNQLLLYSLLALTIFLGLTLRTWNVNFDRGIGSHPDERSTACFYATSIHLPQSWAEFRDPKLSPLNPLWDTVRQEPRRFTYGHFPLYLGVATGNVLHGLAAPAERLGLPKAAVAIMEVADRSCDAIAVAGRLVIALLDTLTILLLFLLGRRIYGPWWGLLTAAFYAFAAQAIQLSHFFAMDPASTTFTVLAILGAVLTLQTRRKRYALLTGVAAGLAISSKFSALPILLAPVAAAALIWWDVAQSEVGSDGDGERTGGRARFAAVMGAAVALIAAAFTFFVTSPYAVLDWQNFVQATLVEQGLMVRGVADFPFTRQYRNTLPYIYFIEQQVRWGLGWPLGIVALLGTFWALALLLRTVFAAGATALSFLRGRDRWHQISREEMAMLLVWSWLIPYFGLTGAFLAKFNRYMSPVLPFALLFGAGLISFLWRQGQKVAVDDVAATVPVVSQEEETEQASQSEVAAVLPEADSPDPADSDYSLPAPAGSRLMVARVAALILAVAGIAGGLFWSLAFVNGVYNNEHTWITASRSIYETAPTGSVILWELWDDPLPKAIPNEPGMDMGSTGLRNIDWSPYEEDTAEKYAIMVAKLREADYVAYSSKRIYDSVDELPERYPMTNLYYRSMWDGSLGFEPVIEQVSSPRLLGLTFDDRGADESFSLYDHPQVTVFRKVRDLSDDEFDAIFAGTWETAIPWYRGKDSPLSPVLEALGLGSSPESERRGAINTLLSLLSGGAEAGKESVSDTDLLLATSLDQLPVVDDYRWNDGASTRPWLAALWWWFVLSLLGWLVWPLLFQLLPSLRDRGYCLSRTFGWLLAGWLLWYLSSVGIFINSVRNAWLVTALVGLAGLLVAFRARSQVGPFLRRQWPMLAATEALFALTYVLFLLVRMANPDIWQPWFGGEKFMEFAFLNGILRSPGFPPVDPHFAGGYINYYYFGIYLVAYLIKLTGVYAEVAFNLAIPTLFALTTVSAFGVAYSATPYLRRPVNGGAGSRVSAQQAPITTATEDTISAPASEQVEETSVHASVHLGTDADEPLAADAVDEYDPAAMREGEEDEAAALSWRSGLIAALLAPVLVALIGNLDGFAQVMRNYAGMGSGAFRSGVPGLETAARALSVLGRIPDGGIPPLNYDFWGPSRVIPYTINEFPFWSFLYADLHPHLIGIPFTLFFLALTLALLGEYGTDWRRQWARGAALLGLFGLTLGTLAAVNLWELPTYLGLGLLTYLVSRFRGGEPFDFFRTLAVFLFYPIIAYVTFLPFFRHFVTIGAGGIGLVRQPDDLGTWLLIWGLFVLVLVAWLFYVVSRRARVSVGMDGSIIDRPAGIERALSLGVRRFERLPRLVYLHHTVVAAPSFMYQLALAVIPITLLAFAGALLWGRNVLALCLLLLGPALLLLWRRGRSADPGSLLATLLTVTGLAILAGTQVFYLKDFLQGGDWYRMNTLFKFFIQVWVLWAVAAAVALPRLWRSWLSPSGAAGGAREGVRPAAWVRYGWAGVVSILLLVSFAYPLLGTPARLDQRFVGWRPPFGTLNGLDYMLEGSYTWPDDANRIELAYDREAIYWLLDNMRGNPIVAESSEVDYYRAGGSRVASLTGLSGLRGMHESEQRDGASVGLRDQVHREFWDTPDVARTMQLIEELDIALIYVGQLEEHQHPVAVSKLDRMAQDGLLNLLYSNDRVKIYAVPGALVQNEEGKYIPS